MKAFVAGATGYTGQHVVRELLEGGAEVIAHIRPGSSRLEDLGAEFEQLGAIVDTTPWEDEAMAESLRAHAPDAVFCLIGTTRARMKQLEARGGDAEDANYEAVDYGLTRLLVTASEGALGDSSPHFLYLSSMGVGPNGLNAYMRARYKAEQAVITSSVPHTIARPGIITGEDREEDRTMERVSGKVNDVLFKALGVLGARELEKRYRSTDAGELARALVRLAHDGAHDRVVEAEDLKD